MFNLPRDVVPSLGSLQKLHKFICRTNTDGFLSALAVIADRIYK